MGQNMDKLPKTVFLRKGQSYSPEKETLANDLKELFSIIEDAHYSYEIWWILINRDGRKKYFRAMLHYKEFFEPVARSTLTSMAVALFKLYEYKNNRLSFNKVLKEVQELKLIDNKLNKKLKRKIKEANAIWKKICILRHNLLAHRHYKLTKTEIYKIAEITPNQIKRLIELSLKIFNTLWTRSNNKPKKIEPVASRDTHRVLETLLDNL